MIRRESGRRGATAIKYTKEEQTVERELHCDHRFIARFQLCGFLRSARLANLASKGARSLIGRRPIAALIMELFDER